MTDLLIVAGVLLLSFALRTSRRRLFRKAGALGILASTFLAFYLFTGSVVAGFGGLLLWFLLPWFELLTRIRRLRLPMGKTLQPEAPPGSSRFPELGQITREIEGEGFEHVADRGWDWDGLHQFYRLFYHAENREQAAICLTEQDGISWASLALTSRVPRGMVYRTTNLPFSNPMKTPPEVTLRQVPEAEGFLDLLETHRFWMEGLGYLPEDFVEEEPEGLASLIEQETGRQIRHNLEAGLIRPGEANGTFRYSWRGLLYLYCQLVKDMVRMS
jgi:hypothetical protein